ncbi:MAG: ribose-phosphate pyrophosphokinase [Propionicimonas sp.]
MTDLTVFSGHAHREFAQQMCEILGVELSPSRLSRFSNDCLQVQLRANCRRRHVYIVQPLVPPVQEHLMELLMMVDAARGASAAEVTVVMPHYAYARSDKKDAPRISIGGRLVADLIHTAGASRVLTMALHAQQVHGFFSTPVDQLTALPVLAHHFRNRDLSNTVVVSPDFGNAKDAGRFARLLGVGVAAGSKQRLADDKVVIDTVVGEVTGKDVIVIDDEIATAGSIIELVDALKKYDVGSISVACTHGLFTGPAVERLNARDDIREIVTTNTVPAPAGLERLTVCSVAPLFARAIQRIDSGESISSLLSSEDTYG